MLNKSIIKIRVELQNSKIKKSGKNKFAGFAYYELADFLPKLNELMMAEGVNDIFSINDNVASLVLIKEEEKQEYKIPFVMFQVPLSKQGTPSMQEIQYLGALNTYYKRYLYLNAFGITDGEVIDAMDNDNSKTEVMPTPSMQNLNQAKAVSRWVKDEFEKRDINSDDFKAFMGWNKLSPKDMITQATKFYNNRSLWNNQIESYNNRETK